MERVLEALEIVESSEIFQIDSQRVDGVKGIKVGIDTMMSRADLEPIRLSPHDLDTFGSLSLNSVSPSFIRASKPFNYLEVIRGFEKNLMKYLKHERRVENRKKLHARKPKRKTRRKIK